MRTLIFLLTALSAVAVAAPTQPRIVALPSKSPLVTIRLVFLTGAAADPTDKPGLASMTAAMLTDAGSKNRTYKQIIEAMYPMATRVSSQVDKEMVTFSGATHIDNLEAFYGLFKEMLLEPGWREDDFTRVKDDHINYLRVSLRGNNDEELGKQVLYDQIYAGHPYGHPNAGTVSALQKMTIADLQKFYKTNFRRSNLIIGIAGGYPSGFDTRIAKDFDKLETGYEGVKLPEPKPVRGLQMTMIEKPTRSVAYSFGFPLDVKRGDPDFPALLVAQSYLGQHRSSGGMLYTTMRQARGLNYGDYAYIEHFPNGGQQFEPPPNVARHQQVFQIWIRPVEIPTAHFALRLAMFEYEKFLKNGLSEEDFQRSRSFLSKYVNILTQTKSAELGYAIDSTFYGIKDYNTYLKGALAKLTRDDVNRAIKKHLQAENMSVVVVAQNCNELKDKFLGNEPSPMAYNSPKPQDILEEDKIIEKMKLPLTAESIKIVPVGSVFE